MNAPKPRGLLNRIIAAAAEQLAKHPSIPPESREAFRINAISVFEQQVSAIIGYDTVKLTGWVILPSERQARRERILEALQRGDLPSHIASRELVSVRWVEMLRRNKFARTSAP